jgi:putative ABC transport system permease protein
MANNEIRAAFRTFYREKSYAAVNLSGLSLAIACSLILGLYLRSELTYDQHHLRHKQIFRVVNEFAHSGPPDRMAYTPMPLGPMLKENYPEVKDYVRFLPPNQKVLIRSGDKTLYWENVYSTDENVFDIFTHRVLYGDPKTALKDPSSAAVSETFARQYFGDSNPIGKTIHAEAGQTFEGIPRRITLVFRDLAENTHLKYDVLFRWVDPPNIRQALFGVSLFTYLLMPENYRIDDFKIVSNSFFARFMEERLKTTHSTWKGWLQPLADIHLHSDLLFDLPTGNRYYIYGFAAVAVFILLVACINYVNLAIARAAKRAKEIGMRKILGASRSFLMFRFLSEAVIFSLIATVFGAALVEIVLRLTPIHDLLGKSLQFRLTDEPALLLWMLGLSLFIGLLSGIYPALYLSSIAPLSALASSQGGKKGNFRLRELLVLTQFTVSVIVVACTLIMAQQMRYVSNKPLGFNKENRVLINLHGLDVIEKFTTIKNELLQDSRIMGIAATSTMISTDQFLPASQGMVDNKDGVLEATSFAYIQVTEDFWDVMDMQMVSGRNFSKKLLTDVGLTCVINETMAKVRGWQEPLGKRIQLGGYNGKVIGVVKDFHFKSLHSPVEPLVMFQFIDDLQNVSAAQRAAVQRVMILRIVGKDSGKTLEFLRAKFAEYDPWHPFEFAFLDESNDRLYLSEKRLMKMTGIFSGICIFISCLGLFGLAAFTAEQRTKEIGIRKVLGASASQIIMMLARKTLWLVLAGSVVASIVAYYAMDEWLSGFASGLASGRFVFVISAAIVIAVAFITVALQSYRAARANPALTLRYE